MLILIPRAPTKLGAGIHNKEPQGGETRSDDCRRVLEHTVQLEFDGIDVFVLRVGDYEPADGEDYGDYGE